MVEFVEAGLFLDLLLQGFHGTRNVQSLNAATLRADEVIVVVAGLKQRVIGATVMQTQAADESEFLQLDQHTIDRGLVRSARQIR